MGTKSAQLAVLLTAMLGVVGVATANAATPKSVSSKATCSKLVNSLNEKNEDLKNAQDDIIALLEDDIITSRNITLYERMENADPSNKKTQQDLLNARENRAQLQIQLHVANAAHSKAMKSTSAAVTDAQKRSCPGRIESRIEQGQRMFFTQSSRFNKRRLHLNREYAADYAAL